MRGRAFLLYGMCCTVWGSTWMVIKIGLTDLPPFLFGGARMTIACLALIPFASALLAESVATRVGVDRRGRPFSAWAFVCWRVRRRALHLASPYRHAFLLLSDLGDRACPLLRPRRARDGAPRRLRGSGRFRHRFARGAAGRSGVAQPRAGAGHAPPFGLGHLFGSGRHAAEEAPRLHSADDEPLGAAGYRRGAASALSPRARPTSNATLDSARHRRAAVPRHSWDGGRLPRAVLAVPAVPDGLDWRHPAD